jgi:diguanylate cyclase (GGDEF)-like protein/PAS domain S-box-containing protein
MEEKMKYFKINVTSLIILALIFGLGGLSFFSYIKTRDLLIANLEMHISSLTVSSGSEVGLWLNAHKKEIEAMANTPLAESGDKLGIVPYMNKETQRNKEYEEFFIADSRGNYTSNTGKTGSIADRDYFQKVMSLGNTVVSDPLISRGSGNQIIVVAAPIMKGSHVVGLLGGTVSLTELAQIVTSESVGEIGYAFVVQEDGLIITHPEESFIMTYNVLKDKNASQNFKEAVHNMIQGKTGFTRYSIQSEDKYLAYAPVPGVKWSLGVTVPVTYVANQLRYLPIYFIVMTILFGIILAFILSRWLVNPLTDLEKFSTELNDNLHKKVDNYQVNSPVIEVKSLATNFRKMVAALQESFRELESSKANLKGEIVERTMIQENLEKSYEELGAAEEELRCNYEKLQSQEIALRESERRFRSMLENVQLITGIMDKEGRIIFINDFALGLTGYKKEEVIGHSYFGMFIPDKIRENAIDWFRESLNNKKIIIHDFDPIQTKNGEIRFVNWNHTLLFDSEGNVSGVASIGEDITERKQFQERLKHMSFHDSLTGLYNRTYFEEELRLLEEDCFAPVGMIVCDVDGLKLVNDTFGHSTGDKLLWLTAGIIKKCFREEDKVCRIGGDEFAIILPRSELSLVEHACHRIRKAVERYNIENEEFPLSLSVGFAVSGKRKENVRYVFKEADNNMYQEKLHRSKSSRSAIVQALMKTLEARDFITEGHGERLQDIVISLGVVLGLSERNLANLRLLAQFHDIGKVGIPDRILFKPGSLTDEEFKEMKRHSEIGHRIAQSAPDLQPIADYILRHHEWWNGGGYPLGLKEESIPLECRILAIADAYDAMTSDRPYRKAMSQKQAFDELNKNSGIQFDPKLVPIFIKVNNFDQLIALT